MQNVLFLVCFSSGLQYVMYGLRAPRAEGISKSFFVFDTPK